MNVDVLPIGLYQENVYVVHDKGHVFFVDPGRYAKEIIKTVGKDEVVDGIILTHGHADHTGAVDDLAEHYNCPVYMHTADYVLCDPKEAKRGYTTPIYAEIIPLNTLNKIGNFDISVYHTPGHTAGSCCIQYRNLLFTGDTLFASDIGRTDLFSGDEGQMMESLSFLKTLRADLIVLPGHGPRSTIANEIRNNPYFR